LQIRIIRIRFRKPDLICSRKREKAAMRLRHDLSPVAPARGPLAAAIGVVLGAASPLTIHAQEAGAQSESAVLVAAASDESPERTQRANRRRGQILEEVTVEGQKYRNEVSSPKYTAELVNLPQTVVVIPKTVFREQAAVTLSDVLRNTPAITLLAGEGGGASNTAGDSFFMRGFDATNSIFIDGVRDQGAYSRDVFNLDQVEVSKGPSGSYTGRGNASGSVNLVTKTPFEEPLRAVGLTYGSNDHMRSTLDFNQPLPEDFLGGSAVRLNAMWQDGGVAGRDEVERDAWGIAPSFALGLGTDTRLTLAAQILRQENTPDYGLPAAALPGLAPTTPPVGHVDQNNFYGIAGVDFDDIDSDSYTARIEHDFAPGVTLRNLTRYSDNHRLAVVTVIQNPAGVRSGDRAGDARPPDQRAHQPQFHEPDEPELRVPDRLAVAFDEHRRRVREREADQPRSHGRGHRTGSRHLSSESA
jgi:catecholate siderophore receptor